MKYFYIDGVEIITDLNDMTDKEAIRYLLEAADRADGAIVKLVINGSEDGMLDVSYECKKIKFERIRRITGYLVGTLDKWNNAKQAEEHERVKHL